MSERIALVTGANRGLGRECVRQLAFDGWTVVLGARTEAKGVAAADALNRQLGRESVHPRTLDVTDEGQAQATAAFIAERWGRLDALVNNAGTVFDDADEPGVLESSADVLMQSFRNNTVGPFLVTRACAALLREGQGTVTMVSSGMGGLAQMGGGFPGYRVSKAGLHALTRIFHNALNPHGVRVNAVCPGWVQTDMGGPNATRPVDKGAESILWAVRLGPDGPSGGFFRDGTPLLW
jgi:NAD(P)-dependent dehydrogenase (short-subunit alcohol dehydrogenase family)